MRHLERFTRGGVDETSSQGFAWRECHRVHDDVEGVPMVLELRKSRRNLGIRSNIHGHRNLATHLTGQFDDALFESIILISERELGPFPVHGLSNAPADRALRSHAHDEGAFSSEKT